MSKRHSVRPEPHGPARPQTITDQIVREAETIVHRAWLDLLRERLESLARAIARFQKAQQEYERAQRN